MRAIIKVFFLIYMLVTFAAAKPAAGFLEVFFLLLIAAVNIWKDKYCRHKAVTLLGCILILWAAWYDSNFAILLCIPLYDLIIDKGYFLLGIPFAGLLFFFWGDTHLPVYMLIAAICALTAYIFHHLKEKSEAFKLALDDERRLRYELEQTKSKLMQSARETARMTEISERNRIARELHDHAGHQLAGILIQLQAGMKIRVKNPAKSEEMLNKAVEGLSQAITLIRDTVHRLKPNQGSGLGYIHEIIRNFSVYPVDFRYTGDFNRVSARHMDILATNVKEALTNVSKHTRASKIEIRIDIHDHYIRLFFKDNGQGCVKIKEGMGLSGMRERVTGVGGSFSVSGNEGFIIVCILPMDEGVHVFENDHRG